MTIKIAQERHRYIIQEIRSSGSVSTLDLARTLRVSGETIRRDFAYLEQQGFLHRVYGGAILTDLKVTTEPGFHERRAINPHAKSEIGRTAAELLNDETSIFIDVGTTAETIATALPPQWKGTVFTNSLLVAEALPSRNKVETILTPGILNREERYVRGSSTALFLDRIRFDTAFISCGGIDIAGATDFDADTIELKRIAASRSNQTFIVADSTKHNRMGTFEVSRWYELSGLITNEFPPERIRTTIVQSGGRVITPNMRT